MLKYLYYFLISIVLVFLQQNILPNLGFLNNLNFLLVILVFITIISGFDLGFIFALIVGFIYNIFSFLPLGTFIIIYLVILILVNFLYKNVLINFSFLTNFILIIMATLLYNFLLPFVTYIFYALNIIKLYIVIDNDYIINFLKAIILNSLLISFIFIIAKLTIQKLNLVFLIKK